MSEKTVLQRFQAKPGDGIALVVAEDGDRALLGALPDGATEAPVESAAIVVSVVRTRDELLARYAEQLPVASGARAVWVVYPKGGRADVNRDVVAGEARLRLARREQHRGRRHLVGGTRAPAQGRRGVI